VVLWLLIRVSLVPQEMVVKSHGMERVTKTPHHLSLNLRLISSTEPLHGSRGHRTNPNHMSVDPRCFPGLEFRISLAHSPLKMMNAAGNKNPFMKVEDGF